jgi:hypothetical protein
MDLMCRDALPICPPPPLLQATAVCDWMEHVRGNGCAAVVLCGDMNAGPDESLHSKLRKLGYRSAYKTVHGHEPEVRGRCQGRVCSCAFARPRG